MVKKFSSNEERLAHIKSLFELSDDVNAPGMKLAWEWLTTGKFGKKEFHQVMKLYAEAAVESERLNATGWSEE